jgi:short subunit dehydrogenase-like uncharacterized protein
MEGKQVLIYGANGYTGKLFAKHLLAKGMKPILAARSAKVERTGKELKCATRIFGTDDAADHLLDIDVLVNFAGPFSSTQDGLIRGCISSKTHYLDIAGEFTEVEKAFKYDAAAQESGIVIIPAAGFGVVPTDIAAKLVCDKIEAPNQLTLAYATVGGASRGTLKTVLKDIRKAGRKLRNGQYQTAQPAESHMDVTVFGKRFKAVYNPWRADLYTARLSTGVSNIETYSEFPGFVVSMMKGKLQWLRNLILKRLIGLLPEGPSDNQLKKGKTYIKAIARNDNSKVASIEIKGPEAYHFTVICVEHMIRLISSSEVKKGCLTPSMLGTEWLKSIDGVEMK